jgi:ATP-binding cassette subfamily B protein
MSTHAEEHLSHMKTVQAYNQQTQVSEAFEELLEKNLARSNNLIVAAAQLVTANAVIQNLAYLVVIALGGQQVMAGEMSVGDLAAYIVYVFLIGNTFVNVAHFWPYLQTAAGATERMFELLQTENQIADPAKPMPLPKRKGGREVVFQDIHFSYPTRPEIAAAEGIQLKVPANSRVAIVGPSGAGKSTLFQLLLRFYAPQKGQVKLDGVDIRKLTLHDLRGQMALVSQDPVVFAGTVAENIRFGRPDATDEQVKAAAVAAFADGFIRKLPKGYKTTLGERGVKLSGGERQRIAIARAVLCDPAILLLDEATSNLDAEAEAVVQKALDKLMQGRTTLVIAHRLSTVVKSDKIIVMEKGRIVAEGTHAALLKSCPLYKKLAMLQLQAD